MVPLFSERHSSLQALGWRRRSSKLILRTAPRPRWEDCGPNPCVTSTPGARLLTDRPIPGQVRARRGMPLTSPLPRGRAPIAGQVADARGLPGSGQLSTRWPVATPRSQPNGRSRPTGARTEPPRGSRERQRPATEQTRSAQFSTAALIIDTIPRIKSARPVRGGRAIVALQPLFVAVSSTVESGKSPSTAA